MPFTIEALGSGNLEWNLNSPEWQEEKTLQYSKNGGEWLTMTSATTVSVNTGDLIQFKGEITQFGSNENEWHASPSCNFRFNVMGNIMSLSYGDDFTTATSVYADNFERLFYGLTNMVSAEHLVLPATTLAERCYSSMFQGCTSLVTPPSILPATALAYECYSSMFSECESLTTAPELPAITLAEWCYAWMFFACFSLAKAPALPATILAEGCYSNMFYYCDGLSTAPALPATTLAEWCYEAMFRDCDGLSTAPALPATTLAKNCYATMFADCSNLSTMPELPATALVEGCYGGMFGGCTNLNYIKCLATDISATGCTQIWLDNVSPTGTFVKNPNMSSWTTGTSGIPTNWAVQDAS